MALRILEMLLGNIFVTVAAFRLLGPLKTGMRHLDIPILGFLWLFTTTLYALMLGILGLLEPHRITVISSIGLALLITPTLRGLRGSPVSLSDLFGSFNRAITSLRTRLSFLEPFLFSMLLLQVTRIVFHIWYIPPHAPDTLTYHLVNVAEWVQKGRIHAIISPVGRVYWPANFEVLEAWFAVFLHHDILVTVVPFLYYLVAGASAYAIARVLGLGRTLSATAATLYLFTPSLAIQATACKNDIAIAAVYLLAIAVLLDLLRNVGHGDRRALRRRIAVVGMALCLGLGTKPYLAVIFPAPLLIGLLAVLKQRSRGYRLFKFEARRPASTALLCVFLILACALLGFYWYGRNWVLFDNPFFPTNFRIGDHLVFGSEEVPGFQQGQRGSASIRGLWRNLYALVTDRILDHHRPFTPPLANMAGWGWFNFVCGLSALAYALVFVRRLRLLIVSFILSLLGLFAFVTTDPFFMRFTLWFPVVFALSFVSLLSDVSAKWLKKSLLVLAMLCTLLNWVAVLNVGLMSVNDVKRMMQLPALERSTARLLPDKLGRHKTALEIVPEDEVIGFCSSYKGRAYPLYDSDFSRRVNHLCIEDSGFIENMMERDIRYLFVDRMTRKQRQLTGEAVQQGHLRKLAEGLYVLEED